MEAKNQKDKDKRPVISMTCLCVGSILSAFPRDTCPFWLAIVFFLPALALNVVILVEEFKKSRKH